jgi:CubicO group peptidase (beta-lactamase class C family)
MPATIAVLACASNVMPAPTTASLDAVHMRAVTEFLDSAVASGAAPGAVLAVLQGNQRFIHGTGQLGADHPERPGPETLYDLASVTKVVGLATGAMLAVEEGKLDLDAPVQRYLPDFSGSGKDRVTVRMLLVHASGLPGWRPLFREVRSRSEMFAAVDTTTLEAAAGTREKYSDLGAIVLTQLIETIYHERLDSLLRRRVFDPLAMNSTGYSPDPALRNRIAPTELDRWLGRVLQGEVHDENAAMMDGVSGHAGLFSSAADLLTFAEWILEQGDRPTGGQAVGKPSGLTDRPTVGPAVLREFTRRQNLVPGSSQGLLWDTPSPGGSAGRRLSSMSFGHVGFTGTSLWIDPEHRVAIVLLSNRVNPTRNNPRWNPLRAAVADRVMTTLFEDAQ